ncbi:hypothetical protein SDRG_15466 [Saprolegnia diclina VS20]|uniref:FYVE-type domain-containing protein n=1 Tax=Saprolegnia diclina (strain VS20) TaxID=1156394 RepID=T0RAZ3_SAPDV|nr:hypothetical protein SDRG_15466 [Saprolegnia diclina VS20]EQC26737.1 hypothetical protein SDRG_15466 [Saprolegnia diclina VS20]|eukprot:XP_008619861.1 hypothetical protein SDRG_15466 [Saprolegnia diclina VS20]
MPEFSYTIVGPATIYSQHPIEAEAAGRSRSRRPATSESTKKTVAFARDCALAFAKDCMEMNHRALASTKSSPSVHFDDMSRQYSVHAMLELHASLTDVLEVFAQATPAADPFLARVFDGALEMREVTSYPPTASSSDVEISATSLKRVRFNARVFKKELVCLEHIETLTPTSIVRYFESVDESVGHDDLPRHHRLTFGYYFEKVSRSNRLRLTFYGSHVLSSTKPATNLGADETCRFLNKLGDSISLLTKIVLRRRLALELPQSHRIQMDAPPPLPAIANASACMHCKKTFRLFRKANECQLCHGNVCAKCCRHEEIETADGLVTRVHVCHVCFKQVQDKYAHQVATKPRSQSRPNDEKKATNATTTIVTVCRCGRPSAGACGSCAAPCCAHCSVRDPIPVGGGTVLDLQLCHACALRHRAQTTAVARYSDPIILHDEAPSHMHNTELMRTVSLSEKKASSSKQRYLRQNKPVLLFDPADLPLLPELDEPARASRNSSSNNSKLEDGLRVSQGSSNHSRRSSLPPPAPSPMYPTTTHAPMTTTPKVGTPVAATPVVATEAEETLVDQIRHFACLDVGTNDVHDAFCRSATTDMDCANAYVTLIYQGAYILKGAFGASVPAQVPADCALTAATLANDLLVVPDASADVRFLTSPRVTGKERVRFYCGLPIVTMDGLVLGTVAVADAAPRLRMPSAHLAAMQAFQSAVVELIESRLQAALESND